MPLKTLPDSKSVNFSIVIPTRNRAEILHQALDKISNLDFNKSKYNLMVVDNDSADNTKDIVNRFRKLHPDIKTQYFREKRIGPSFCRNRGIAESKSNYIVFIDDDVLVEEDLLLRFTGILSKHPEAALVGGKSVATYKNTSKLRRYLEVLDEHVWVYSHTRREENVLSKLKYPDMLMSSCILINRNMFQGLFDEDLGRKYGGSYVFAEDSELCLRILGEGNVIIYDPQIVTRHMILDYKVSPVYVLKRFFQSGLEQKILDNKLLSRGQDRMYTPDVGIVLSLLSKAFIKPSSKKWLQVAKEVIYMYGYNSLKAKSILGEIGRN